MGRHRKHNDDIYPAKDDPYYIDLKAYRSGRSKKIGLFTNADRVDMIGFNMYKTAPSPNTGVKLWGRLLNQTYTDDNLYSNAYEALTDNMNKKPAVEQRELKLQMTIFLKPLILRATQSS